jgi:hypothetical protein
MDGLCPDSLQSSQLVDALSVMAYAPAQHDGAGGILGVFDYCTS